MQQYISYNIYTIAYLQNIHTTRIFYKDSRSCKIKKNQTVKKIFQKILQCVLIKISYISIYPTKNIASFLGFTAFQTQASRISKLLSSTSLAFWRFFFISSRKHHEKLCVKNNKKGIYRTEWCRLRSVLYRDLSGNTPNSSIFFNEEGLPRFEITRKRLIKFGIFFP